MKKSFIAMFHIVHDPQWFESILMHLKKDYSFVSADTLLEIYKNREFHKAQCHITFDDGHGSFYANVLPILIKHQIPATIFVSPQTVKNPRAFWFQREDMLPKQEFKAFLLDKLSSRISSDILVKCSSNAILKTLKIAEVESLIQEFATQNNISFDEQVNMNMEQLRVVIESGLVELGAHTMNHPILANEDDESSEYEIAKSIEETAELSGKKVCFFACPNGIRGIDFGQREEMILQKHGIQMNVSTTIGALTDKYGPYCMPRIGISKGDARHTDRKIKYAPYWQLIRRLSGKNSDVKNRIMLRESLKSSSNKNQ